jgi:acyl carrier protein
MKESQCMQSRIMDLLATKLNVEIPSVDTNLIENRYIDSLSFVDFMVSLEEEFRFSIPFEELDLDRFNTIASISLFISQHAAKCD